MKFNKLVIVSDTALFYHCGKYFAFGPVVREIEFIQSNFDKIVWIGFNRRDKIGDLSMQKIQSPKIKVVLLNQVGGKGILSFLKILINYPVMGLTILKHIKNADIIHSRAPSHPALIAELMSFFFRNKIWWHKYAGNWNQKNPPLSYGFQRWFLKKNFARCKVTINGFWPDQPAHCYSFENPCLTEKHIADGKQIAAQKVFFPPFKLAFVGRLEDAKGVSRIIEALKNIPVEKIEKVHFIGSGDDLEKYKNASRFLGEKVLFHGFQNSEKVHQILKESHFFLLPSQSEGFPKVIAEAACYGCIPIVSNVGSIPHYISEKQGFVWPFKNDGSYAEVVREAVQSSPDSLAVQSQSILALAEKFTYASYYKKLVNQVFKS